MRIVSLRRYPVKAMGGESLDRAAVDARGLTGDRAFAVVDAEGWLAAGKRTRRFRRHDEVFDYAASTVDDAVVVSRDGLAWRVGDAALDADLSAAMGEPMRVLTERDSEHSFYDASPVSLVGTATLDWCRAELGVDADPRRLRVNVVVETEEPFVEEGWIGSEVVLGDVRLRVAARNERCRVIDLAQDGVEETARWLKPLGERRDACLAVYAHVVGPGELRVGDPVRVDAP
ncbi:MAG: MOSC domain-containing protein [Actinomycetes bacterium]